MNKYIFLDFDGVLNINGKKTFYRSQHFADCIVELDNLFVVFSTSWREYAPLERLVNLMPKKIQHKCVGKTPLINDDIKHVRYHEILSYTNENNISDNQWVAIDDMDCLFPKYCKNLILTNPSIGFSRQEAKKIRDFYENNFFDTEFDNFADLTPISIGFVSECEKFQFYNENTQYNLATCSGFVKEHILTKLDLDKYGNNKAGIRKNFENWVNNEVDDDYLLFISDYSGDMRIFWKLFSDLNTKKRIQTKLLGASFSLVAKERMLYDHKKMNKCFEVMAKEIEFQLGQQPEMIHHALYDAIGNCRGFKKALDFLKN